MGEDEERRLKKTTLISDSSGFFRRTACVNRARQGRSAEKEIFSTPFKNKPEKYLKSNLPRRSRDIFRYYRRGNCSCPGPRIFK